MPYPFSINEQGDKMKEYIKAQNKTNEIVLKEIIKTDELCRFSQSDFRWANNRKKEFLRKKIRKGEIYQIEFGKNYVPEMSYEHRGLIIGVKDKLLYVLPIFSYDSVKHTDVYHPIDYLDSNGDLYLLKSSEFSFVKHDSVLKLNDIRTISINRILYQQSGRIDSNSDTYKNIESLVLRKYFAEFYFEYKNSKKEIEEYKEQVLRLENDIQKLKMKSVNM